LTLGAAGRGSKRPVAASGTRASRELRAREIRLLVEVHDQRAKVVVAKLGEITCGRRTVDRRHAERQLTAHAKRLACPHIACRSSTRCANVIGRFRTYAVFARRLSSELARMLIGQLRDMPIFRLPGASYIDHLLRQ
jgi:hypothetical protein